MHRASLYTYFGNQLHCARQAFADEGKQLLSHLHTDIRLLLQQNSHGCRTGIGVKSGNKQLDKLDHPLLLKTKRHGFARNRKQFYQSSMVSTYRDFSQPTVPHREFGG